MLRGILHTTRVGSCVDAQGVVFLLADAVVATWFLYRLYDADAAMAVPFRDTSADAGTG